MAVHSLVILLLLTSWISADGQTQYVQTDGKVDTAQMIHDLKLLVGQDSALQELRSDILIELTSSKVTHPDIRASEVKKAIVTSTIHQLANGKGSFSFLYKKGCCKYPSYFIRIISSVLK